MRVIKNRGGEGRKEGEAQPYLGTFFPGSNLNQKQFSFIPAFFKKASFMLCFVASNNVYYF